MDKRRVFYKRLWIGLCVSWGVLHWHAVLAMDWMGESGCSTARVWYAALYVVVLLGICMVSFVLKSHDATVCMKQYWLVVSVVALIGVLTRENWWVSMSYQWQPLALMFTHGLVTPYCSLLPLVWRWMPQAGEAVVHTTLFITFGYGLAHVVWFAWLERIIEINRRN